MLPALQPQSPTAHPQRPFQPQQTTQTQTPVADTGAIRCLCTFTDDDGETIFCDQCGFWQHMSCVGLANKPKEELPESWYCWYCKPDKFEWVLSLNGSSGDTLAASLGISQSHWNPSYVASLGLGLDIGSGAAGPSSSSPFSIPRSASSSLRISNLLSPAPPPPPPPKILLDPAKAKKRQETRRVEEERLKKHQRDAHAVTAGAISQNLNSTNLRTEAGSAHVRKASVAQADKPKGRKAASSLSAAAAVAARGGTEALAGSSGAGPSTAGASTSTLASAASTAAAKRKSSSAVAALKNRSKDKEIQPPKLTIPEASPRFNYPSTPLPSSTPRITSLAFALPKSPRPHVGALARSRTRSRSLSVDHAAIGDENGDVEMDDQLGTRRLPRPEAYSDMTGSGGEDYFAAVGKGKGKEREIYSPTARDGLSTTPFISTPYLSNGQPPYPPHITSTVRSPIPTPVYPPRPPHPLTTSLGAGAKISVPKGVGTGSALSRPMPLVVRSFPVVTDPTSGDAPTGLALFLDPQPPAPPQPRPPSVGSARQPLSPISGNALALPSPYLAASHDALGPSLSPSSFAIPNLPPNSLSPLPAGPETMGPKLSPVPSGPNAIVRPLMCGERSRRKGLESSVMFGVFVLRELVAGEAISLGWEMKEPLSKSVHNPTSISSTISYIADTFITCGSCGRKTIECLPDAMKAIAGYDRPQDDEVQRQRSIPPVDETAEAIVSDSSIAVSVRSKRLRSPIGSEKLVDNLSFRERPAKRTKLINGYATPDPTPGTASATPLPTPSTAVATAQISPEISIGLDTSLRRLYLAPGTPVLPSPRAHYKASWKSQLERSQNRQAEIVSTVYKIPVGLGLTAPGGYFPAVSKDVPISRWDPSQPPVPIGPSAGSPSPISTLAPPEPRHQLPHSGQAFGRHPCSMSSSPLTEQSDSGDEKSENALSAGYVKSPRLVNGRSVGGVGTAGKRTNRVRIESTPPLDTDGQLDNRRGSSQSAAVQSIAVDLARSPPRDRDGSTSADDVVSSNPNVPKLPLPPHQRGPPRFRKWVVEPPQNISAISIDAFTDFETQGTPPSRTASPIPASTDMDGDVNMETVAQDIAVPSPRQSSPEHVAASFSIRNLLNPAPDKSMSRLPKDVLRVPAAPTSQASFATTEAPIPEGLGQVEPSRVSPIPSLLRQNLQPSFVRTSSPTLNLLLGGPASVPDEHTAKPSPRAETHPRSPTPPRQEVPEVADPDPPSPHSETSNSNHRQSSPPDPGTGTIEMALHESIPSPEKVAPVTPITPVVEQTDFPLQSVEESHVSPSPVSQALVDEPVEGAAEEAIAAVQSPLHPAPSPLRVEVPDGSRRVSDAARDMFDVPNTMDIDPPPSSPLSEAPPELPEVSNRMLSSEPVPQTPRVTLNDKELLPEVTSTNLQTFEAQSTSTATSQVDPHVPVPVPPSESSPCAPPPASLPALVEPAPAPDHALSTPTMDTANLLGVSSPAPSSATAQSPKPAIRKMSFADYAKRRKADQEKLKQKARDSAPAFCAGGSGALNLVLEEKEHHGSHEVAVVADAPLQSQEPAAPSDASLQEEIIALNAVPADEASLPLLQLPLPGVARSPTHLPIPSPSAPSQSMDALHHPVPVTGGGDGENTAITVEPPEVATTSIEDEAKHAKIADETLHVPMTPPRPSLKSAGPHMDLSADADVSSSALAGSVSLAREPPSAAMIVDDVVSIGRPSVFLSSPAMPMEELKPLDPPLSPRMPSSPVPGDSNPHQSPQPNSPGPVSSPSSRQPSESPRTPALPTVQFAPNVQDVQKDDNDTAVALSPRPSPRSPELPDRKFPMAHKSKLILPDLSSTTAPLNDDTASDLARKLQLAAAAGERDRYHPVAPHSFVQRKPPTAPRHARSLAPINTVTPPAEEGEIMSSPAASPVPPPRSARSIPGPSSTSAPPTQPRFHTGGVRTPTRNPSPPPTTPFRPPSLLSRMPPSGPRGSSNLPSGPRALREGSGQIPPRGPASRVAPSPQPGWDARDDRDRDWDVRDRERERGRDERDGRERERGDRDRDRRWDREPRWRGRGRPWGGR